MQELKYTQQRINMIAKLVANELRQGKIAVIPTDTSYGIAADATREETVLRVFQIKRRPLTKPVSIFVSSIKMIKEYFIITDIVKKSLSLLPGKVTLILYPKNKDDFPKGIISQEGKVGVRLPPHPLPPRIVEALGKPITATSANISGKPPIYDAYEVKKELPNIDILVNAGKLPKTPVSTIIDIATTPPRILRQGPVSRQLVEKVLKTQVLIQNK